MNMIVNHSYQNKADITGNLKQIVSPRQKNNSSLLDRLINNLLAHKLLFGGSINRTLETRKIKGKNDGEFVFKKNKAIVFSLHRNYVYIVDKKLGIVVARSLDDFKKNSRKTMNNLLYDYFDYYQDLYIDYVLNPDDDVLSKDAIKLKNIIEGELEDGELEK